LKFNDKQKAICTGVCYFVEDLIRVKKVYEPFLKQLHFSEQISDNNETAKVYSAFMEQTRSNCTL
jgi:hypothetical protein